MVRLSFSILILLPALSYADPLHLPLTRRAPATQGKDYYNSMADQLRAKYGISGPSKRATSANINLTNVQVDASYFATVDIGTPPQSFGLILDTGSADLWVADTSCTNCQVGATLFNPSASSTYQVSTTDASISYGSGSVAGQLAQDVVTMGGFTISNQVFLAADSLTARLLSGPVAGIFGLGFQSIAATGAMPFWEALTNGGELSSPEMSFYLTRYRGDTSVSEEEPGGTFTLGGTNSSLYTGSIEYLDVTGTESFWLLNLAAVTVQGNPVSITTGSAALSAIDTGTTLIGGPTADVTAIWDAVGGTPVADMAGYFQFPCSTTMNVSMSFGGQTWPINPLDMNLGPVSTGSTQCLGGIFDLSLGSNIASGSGNPNWVVGATFLKNVYSVFRSNPASIGFAQLSAAAGGSGTPGAAPTGISSSNSANKAGPAILLFLSLLASFLVTCLL